MSLTKPKQLMDERVEQDGVSAEVPHVVIQPSKGWSALQLDRLWQYRELLYFLVWRDIKVRYKQTMLGVAWIVLQPIVSITIFTILFGYLLNVPSGNVPYPVFLYAALLPWTYFSGSLTRATNSLVGNAHLITKVYFPRLIIPVSGVVSALIDFAIGLVLLLVLMGIYRIVPNANILFLPGFILLAMITALGFGLWFAALNVRFRDVTHLIPFVVQVWFYLTPVVYGADLLPERFRFLLALNPMTGVVEGFRWSLLGGQMADSAAPTGLFWVSVLISVMVLLTGVVFFRRTERTFADII